MKKVLFPILALAAWCATIFTYMLPDLHIAHASEDEAMPFVIAFGVLSLVLTLRAFQALAASDEGGSSGGSGGGASGS